MSISQQVKQTLKEEIKQAVIESGLATEEQIPDVVLEKPKEKDHGDYATNVAMQLARVAKKAPRQIAEAIVEHLNKEKARVTKIDIAGPGFINFFMDNRYLTQVIKEVLDQKENYGRSTHGGGEKIQVEFVSANPTGDLHLGHARGASVGDSLCHLLDWAGYDVEREYYINDAGNQINNLALSVEARYMQALGEDFPMPEDGYHGKDILTIGDELKEAYGDKFVSMARDERLKFFRDYGLRFELKKLEQDLADFRVTFDHWFSETSLYDEGKIEPTLALLKEKGHTYEEDGATWFRTTAFGDDKDRVLIKNDGSYTYLTPDISYHKNKLDRGFDKLINIWGADHHGYIPRMKAAVEALGYSKDTLEVEIIQMVSLFENGEKVKMSKRTGKAVTLRELMEEVGTDAVRYFFVMRSCDAHLDFDMDLAKSQSNENPVYYVQYAHARICTLLKQAADKGFVVDTTHVEEEIQSEKGMDLLKHIGDFEEVIAEAAANRTPHRMTSYVFDLAQLLHSYYNQEKVLDESNKAKTEARLALMAAVRTTIKNALAIIGVEAPEQM
ncbi:arginine--tRNA ligase [Halolactibacillus alkaliphilus]|uniref:Arginine--tRNA ligase n=1 Tax=Halolactibacillus alkaliphilus TaxID=442899 RepID=A0A511X251_9BACI|nr:arginine--tRNA ligase [Halolactibacillus alkaliphilus]GEN57024.1 arginine--tRNA ligase [Halolactibacillus alkaliphilus]GGN68482.1 arginine--tRNA ligase [Halolactibacillus alkaliphilus]SFO85629.1 arginyl-tRNA synthetase [Halolactibacillus alkaliphilus]